ncbi:MAG: response regulator [Paracoccaceae bacterium]|nr:response regulator [Paracoccaceae bacterium]
MLDGLRVLLAEDNPTNQMVATQMLESLGASVTIANDGAEALEIVETGDFDLILVDIEMPRVSGIELLRRLRARGDSLAEKPMVALTAYVMREHRAAIAAAGADGVIAKPILSIEQFGSEIRRYMHKRPAPSAKPPGHPGASVHGTDAAGPNADALAVPVIDRGIYDTLAETIGPTAMDELLEKVVSDTQNALDRLIHAEDPLDLDEIRAVSHILISVAGAIGGQRVQDAAKAVNAAAQQADNAATAEHLPRLTGNIRDMLAQISEQASAR